MTAEAAEDATAEEVRFAMLIEYLWAERHDYDRNQRAGVTAGELPGGGDVLARALRLAKKA